MVETALAQIRETLQHSGAPALAAYQPASALEAFYLACISFAYSDFSRAADVLQTAVELDPTSLVFPAARDYLRHVAREGKEHVYTDPHAFGAFIRGGGNLPLYTAVSAVLRETYSDYAQLSLLDIGVGDGMALLPALTPNLTRLELVEPASALLAQALSELTSRGIPCQAHPSTLQEFTAAVDSHWTVDLAQATFSLQSIAPAERAPLLHWLSQRCQRLLIVEFDVPYFADPLDPAYACSILARFEAGLAEYQDDRELVAQGFLIPVMFGYFDRTAARTNYEQPLSAWTSEVSAAGFRQVASRMLYPYWWAPAFLIDAHP